MNEDDYVTRHEFEHLQWQLHEKIDEIEEVREQNSRLALDAAWGIVPSIGSITVWLGVVAAMAFFEDMNWWLKGALIIGAVFWNSYSAGKTNEERIKEIKKLHRIRS